MDIKRWFEMSAKNTPTEPAPAPVEEEEDELSVDDREAPNVFPYKKCTDCGERKSCGNYTPDDEWFCTDCAPACGNCGDPCGSWCHIYCIVSPEGEEEVWCSECWNDLKEEMEAEGWYDQNAESDEED